MTAPTPEPRIPMPAMVELTVKVPAPMLWRLQEVAEKTYGVKVEQMLVIAALKALRPPRGPQADLTVDWKIYQMWLRRFSLLAMSHRLGITRNAVYTRLTGMGLKSHYRDQAPHSGSKRNRGTKSAVGER